jgi:hypothetical protein
VISEGPSAMIVPFTIVAFLDEAQWLMHVSWLLRRNLLSGYTRLPLD